MKSAISLLDALLLLTVILAASGVSLLYYAFLYPLGAYTLAAIAAASGLVWFATPSTDPENRARHDGQVQHERGPDPGTF